MKTFGQFLHMKPGGKSLSFRVRGATTSHDFVCWVLRVSVSSFLHQAFQTIGRDSQQTRQARQFALLSKLHFQEANVLLDGEAFICQRVVITEVESHRVLCSVVIQVLHENVHRVHGKVIAVLQRCSAFLMFATAAVNVVPGYATQASVSVPMVLLLVSCSMGCTAES